MELQVLRSRARCGDCGSKLPPRTEAWCAADASLVLCPTCYRIRLAAAPQAPPEAPPEEPAPRTPATPPVHDTPPVGSAPVDDGTRDEEVPSGGADGEDAAPLAAVDLASAADPEVAADEAPAEGDAPAPLPWTGEFFQGPPVTPRRQVVEKPSVSLKFTAVAAAVARGRPEPADAVGETLHAAENRGLIWMANRTTPTGLVIDHLAVSPNGIWVIEVEPEPDGRVERRDVGDWFTPEPRLFVGEQDRTDSIMRVNATDDALRRALRGSKVADTPRYRVLCFVDSPPGWLDRPFPFDDVWVTWSRHLVEPMLSTVDYRQDDVADAAEVLDKLLPLAR